MYKGTFVAIAEVVGAHLTAPKGQSMFERADAVAETLKWDRAADGAQSSRPDTGVGHSLVGPWTLIPRANDRRCAE